MSSSLIKANRVNIGRDDERVIDSNQAVISRLQLLSEIMESSDYGQDDFADEFSEGLNAEQVSALLDDQDYVEEAGVTQEDIDNLLAQANEQADQIIRDANEQAKQIVANAQAEAESIKAEAFEQGKMSGEQAGYEEGMAQVNDMQAQLEAKMQQNDAALEAAISELEPRFVALLTDIYSHIFKVDLSGHSNIVISLLRDAIRNIDGGKNFFIHVSKDDYETVVAGKDELAAGLASSCVVEVIEDATLAQSECFIESESGIYDCGLGTELELLKKELNLLAYVANE